MEPDPDDIIRDIDEEDADACLQETTRLLRKRRGFRAAFTQSINCLAALVNNTRGENGVFDRTPGTHQAIQRQREKLETRFEKIQKVHHRCLQLNPVEEDENYQAYLTEINTAQARYNQAVEAVGALMIDMLPGQHDAGGAGAPAQANTIKTVDALKPGFTLSFDNTPSELKNWVLQFKAYYEASRLHQIGLEQQQAFMRKFVHPDVWTAIQNKIDMTTRIFSNPDDLEEESIEFYIEEAFTIRYPLITRRYKFFTYQRKGNQTFTNFYAKLRELALAAQLENMGRDDYLIYRLIVGLNDDKTIDKLLAIPNQDFTLEEVHRVATQVEAANNYSNLGSKSVVHQTTTSRKFTPGKQTPIYNKLNEMKKQNKCIRCGQKAHSKRHL